MKKIFALLLLTTAVACDVRAQTPRDGAGGQHSKQNYSIAPTPLTHFFWLKNPLTVTYDLTIADPQTISRRLSGGNFQRPARELSPSRTAYQVLIPLNGDNKITVVGDIEVQTRALAIVSAAETQN